MPNDTIDRGIKKAAGDANADNYERITYEGYTEWYRDHRRDSDRQQEPYRSKRKKRFHQRKRKRWNTGMRILHVRQKGQIIIDKEECEMDADDLMMLALDAGAEDFADEEDSYEIITDPDDFSAVREALEKDGIAMAEADVTMIPQTYVELTDPQALKDLNRTLDLLDDDDDVQYVYTNLDE